VRSRREPLEVDLAPDQRLDARDFALVVEVDRAEQVPMVRQRQRLHAELGGAVHQPVDAAGTVEQTCSPYDMEMDEVGVG